MSSAEAARLAVFDIDVPDVPPNNPPPSDRRDVACDNQSPRAKTPPPKASAAKKPSAKKPTAKTSPLKPVNGRVEKEKSKPKGCKNTAKPKSSASTTRPAIPAEPEPVPNKPTEKKQLASDDCIDVGMLNDLDDDLYQPPLAHDTPPKARAPQHQALAVRPPPPLKTAQAEKPKAKTPNTKKTTPKKMEAEVSSESEDEQPAFLKNVRSIYSANMDDDDYIPDDDDDDDLSEMDVTPKKRQHEVKLEAKKPKTKTPKSKKKNSPRKPKPWSGENFLGHVNLVSDEEPEPIKTPSVKPKSVHQHEPKQVSTGSAKRKQAVSPIPSKPSSPVGKSATASVKAVKPKPTDDASNLKKRATPPTPPSKKIFIHK